MGQITLDELLKVPFAYNTNETVDTDLADDDYIPFYDASKALKRNSLWSNIKSKLKTYFDTLYEVKNNSVSLMNLDYGKTHARYRTLEFSPVNLDPGMNVVTIDIVDEDLELYADLLRYWYPLNFFIGVPRGTAFSTLATCIVVNAFKNEDDLYNSFVCLAYNNTGSQQVNVTKLRGGIGLWDNTGDKSVLEDED